MKRILTTSLCIIAAFFTISCNKGGDEVTVPKMEMELSDVSSTGCSVSVTLSEGAVGYRMTVVPLDGFDSRAVSEELESGAGYTMETRRFERLHGSRSFTVAARPYDADGTLGEMVSENFTLGDFSLEVTLYTPGDDIAAELNRYNTLNVIAMSNGIAARGRCALAVASTWSALRAEKSLKEAAEEVFASNCINLTRQQLEEISDPDPLKRDVMYFNDLSDGTEYTLVVCLEDLDGESHYYSFNGATKRRNP